MSYNICMVVGIIISLLWLLVFAALTPKRGELSRFERHRREEKGGGIDVERELHYAEIVSLKQVGVVLGVVGVVAFSVATLGWPLGLLVSLVVAFIYGRVASFRPIRRWVDRFYRSRERRVFAFVDKTQWLFRVIQVYVPTVPDSRLASREELKYLIENGHSILGEHEIKALTAHLSLVEVVARDAMTPVEHVKTIAQSELLGPLVLDDLHKTGHSRFPVTSVNGEVVGVLHVDELFTLDTIAKHTSRVETVMDRRKLFVEDTDSLEHVLHELVAHNLTLAIVQNEMGETQGIVTLSDCLRYIFGYKF